jgi:hypothetical protein
MVAHVWLLGKQRRVGARGRRAVQPMMLLKQPSCVLAGVVTEIVESNVVLLKRMFDVQMVTQVSEIGRLVWQHVEGNDSASTPCSRLRPVNPAD